MTRFERIKNMTLREMAEEITNNTTEIIDMSCRDDFLEQYCHSNCRNKNGCSYEGEIKCCIKWLKEQIG